MQFFANPVARTAAGMGLFTGDEYDDVGRFFDAHPELQPTPLVHLRALAARAGLADILLKDESARFGLNAFKIAGVAYAVDRLLRDDTPSVLVCATEGNHGRAVARAAAARALRAVVYLRESAAPARIEAIRGEGAEVVLVPGTYDDAVRRVAADASRQGWTIVSDTAWDGYERVPRAIMLGYTWIMTEAARQWAQPPDLIVVQAGVGGLAAAVASWACATFGAGRPLVVCAEPEQAACVRASVEAGRPASLVPGETMMAGLRCGEVSTAALPVLVAAVDACAGVTDADTADAMRVLAHPHGDDPVVEAGPSGACGLAALLGMMETGAWRALGERAAPGSRAFVINTEGATDPARYAEIVRGASGSTTRSGEHR